MTNTSRPASGTDITELKPGTLVEAVPTGVRADGSPITSPIRRRLDRAPWGFDGTSIVISDGRQVDAVHADSVRVIEQPEQRVCVTCEQPIVLDADVQARYVHTADADAFVSGIGDHPAQPKLAHPMDVDPFAGLDEEN